MRIGGATCNLLLSYSKGIRIIKERGTHTMKTLAEINQVYQEITHSDMKEPTRSRKLAGLMNEMEAEYNIPMIRTEECEIRNKVVFVLYRKITRSRKFSEVGRWLTFFCAF